MTPAISIIMPCLNAARTTGRAIESILNQTFSDFEFIIIDDGSEDNTFNVIKSYSKIDDRIICVKNQTNKGLAASLNIAISLAKGNYIARMDADDEAYPDRLEKQYNFLVNNLKVDVLGTGVTLRTKDGLLKGVKFCPETHLKIKKRIFRKPVVFHPTILIKREVFINHGMYNPAIRWAEDADLWYRIYENVIFHNLQEPLLYYTIKDYLSFNHAKQNIKVKLNNLKAQKLLLKYTPQLIYDVLLLSTKMISYRF